MNNNYKVCILTAGAGTRMGDLSNHINKAVLPVNFKAIISHIIEKFPENIEVIIAIGHKKETVIDYLTIAYPPRKFTFIEIDKFVGPGTGPGYSLLQCKKHLQCPFIFITSDTIVLENILPPNENWFGIAPVKETEHYCTVKVKNNLIYQLDDKIKTDNKFAFIGLAGIKDYEIFWNALEKSKEIYKGEFRDIVGFNALIEKSLVPVKFTWFDTGSLQNYINTNKSFLGGEKNFDFSKNNEFIYFVNDKVIKYFANPEIVKKRCERAEYLKGLCPKIEVQKTNFYAYKKIEGDTLYNVLNSRILKDFFEWAKGTLWEKRNLADKELEEFYKTCRKFYYDKTLERIENFYSQNRIADINNIVNGENLPKLKELLDMIDWNYICKGIPVRFHGDFKFGNILVTRDKVSQLQKFILLDWRQDFGGITKYGDIYYDLAKLYAGIILSDELIKEGMFNFDMSGSSVYYDYSSKSSLVEAKEKYEDFLKDNGLDIKKVNIVTAITFLNMSPLHHYPFNFMVYYLGKSILYKSLNQKEAAYNA